MWYIWLPLFCTTGVITSTKLKILFFALYYFNLFATILPTPQIYGGTCLPHWNWRMLRHIYVAHRLALNNRNANTIGNRTKEIGVHIRGGTRGGLGGYSLPPQRHLAPPIGGNFGSRWRKFGKITHGNTIFSHFSPPLGSSSPSVGKFLAPPLVRMWRTAYPNSTGAHLV